jgi:hypothetical protein
LFAIIAAGLFIVNDNIRLIDERIRMLVAKEADFYDAMLQTMPQAPKTGYYILNIKGSPYNLRISRPDDAGICTAWVWPTRDSLVKKQITFDILDCVGS